MNCTLDKHANTFSNKRGYLVVQQDRLIKDDIVDVLRTVVHNPNYHFFGITGDIDDLGVFVARHGRAHAENLVDFISVITEDYFLQWQDKHNSLISSFVVIQGGEEILVLGTCSEKQPLRELFCCCRHEVNRIIQENEYFPCHDLSISFGSALLNQNALIPLMRSFLSDCEGAARDYRKYLEIMYIIRRLLAVCLDMEKFRTFQKDSPELAIAYRNLVYYDLLRHKVRSRNLLSLAAKRWEAPMEAEGLKLVWDEYGMQCGRQESMASLVEILEKEPLQLQYENNTSESSSVSEPKY
jgi:hypothetical protein